MSTTAWDRALDIALALQDSYDIEASVNLSPNVDREADVFTISFLHQRLGQDFPISGDDLARSLTVAD